MASQLKFTNKKEIFNKKIELPEDSGIYQFYDENEKLLYVGKAKNLKNRVSSYLNKGANKKASLLRNQISKNAFETLKNKYSIQAYKKNLFTEIKKTLWEEIKLKNLI